MTMRKLASLSCLFVLLTTLGFAQSSATGDLHVTVKDPKGNVVTNATVTTRDQGQAFERVTTANTEGEYGVLRLPPGHYSVVIDAPGFAKATATDVVITVGQMAELPISLGVAGTQEVVTVSGEAALIETTRTSTTDTIEQSRIDNLPINGRNYINFALTNSQVVRDNAPNIGAAPTSGLNISGQRARSNLVNVDGADATDNSTNGVRSTVSQEAVQEFQIITNGYAAEYGRASGGVVNIVTRSGANDFHGSLFGFLRNRNFQAVNPFSTVSDPAYTRVQAGAAFGGPIKKDKTYYYFSYEITRRQETGFSSIGGSDGNFGLVNFDSSPFFGAPQGTFVVQASPEQAGFLNNFVAAPPPPLLPALQAYSFLVGASSGIALNGSYPASFALLGPPFVPAGLQQFPTSCNGATGNLTCNGLPASFLRLTLKGQEGNFPIGEGTSLYELRLDHNLNSNNRLMFRANVSPSTVTGIEVNGENQTFGQNAFSRTSQQSYRDAAGVAQDTWTIGSNKINEFRFQYARRGLQYFYSDSPGGSDVAVNIPGFAFIGREPYSYIKRTEERYQFSDNFSWTMGRHDMKFGVDFNYIPLTATFTVNYGGVYSFGGLDSTSLGFDIPGVSFPGFSPVQSYGLGIPSTLVQGIGNPNDSFSNKPLGLFWQDSWRIRPNLTLNYGLRYDIEFPPKLAPPDPIAQAAYNALGLQKGIETDKNNFQPRIGIAWNPRGDGKTVLRASYGIFYDHPLLGLYFLGDASDGSKSGQLLLAGGAPCDGSAPGSPTNLNATNSFQGILGLSSCLPIAGPALGYQQNGNSQRFDPFFPNSLFINQNYVTSGFPLIFQPFGYPQAKNFVYASSQQANFSIETDLGHGYALSLAYNFNGGRHLNRPINANTTRGDFLVTNWQRAVAAANAVGLPPTDPNYPSSPLSVAICPTALGGVAPLGPYAPAAVLNFFRPSGMNPSLNNPLAAGACLADSQNLANTLGLGLGPNGGPCDNTLPLDSQGGCVTIPFSDMDANYSNGSSVYHGFTANLRKRFSDRYEFLLSYTWSHAIDDSTDLQSPLAPQDSYFPSLDRSTSLFDQRHRLVFSAQYQSGKLPGDGFASKLFSHWTIAPIIEVASGRPFNILTGEASNFQFSPSTGRPFTVPASSPGNACGPAVPSKFSSEGAFELPCFIDGFDGTLLSLDGNLSRNAGLRPWTVFDDLRVARSINFNERISMDLIVDMFNLANKFNVADVNPLWTNAGEATAAYDPRQFQFAIKIKW